jgi:ribosomal protein L25 (general stress protein Ctc)
MNEIKNPETSLLVQNDKITHSILFTLRDTKHNLSTSLDRALFLNEEKLSPTKEQESHAHDFDKEEKIPMVIYGFLNEQRISINGFISKRDMQYRHNKYKQNLIGHLFQFNLRDENKTTKFHCVLQEVQYASAKTEIIHMDFLIKA